MGLNPFKSDLPSEIVIQPRSSPDPDKFRIKEIAERNHHTLIRINYPDCTNYRGDKILLYRNIRSLEILGSIHLDPHFSESSNCPIPFARFRPTKKGWEMGLKMMEIL